MRPRLNLPGLAGAPALGGHPAPPPTRHGAAEGPRQCFHTETVSGFRAGDGQDVYVRAGARDVYHLRTFGDCGGDIDWALQIGIRNPTGFGSVCTGRDIELIVPQAGSYPARTCRARVVAKLSEEEREALPDRFRP